MPRLVFVVATVLATVLLNGCATTWSDGQRRQLTAVRLAANAYHDPDVKNSPGMSNAIPQMTGGGLIPSLIGSAIDAHVTAKQQREFEAANGDCLPDLKEAFNVTPEAEVHRALNDTLTGHPFFGTRLVEEAKAGFAVEILRYGLARSPASSGADIRLRVRIIVKIRLADAKGGKLLERELAGVASAAKRPTEILADPEFIPNGIRQAANDLARELLSQLDAKLGPDRT
ncbi:MAG TPA: hypothetical protein VHF69_11975 [Candidatus Synoicihabitans sp.]|nr:hypothetical protein [Candidatus Synoicihabitans sp.]